MNEQTDKDLNALFTCAANLLKASKKNEEKFERSIDDLNSCSNKMMNITESVESKIKQSIAQSSKTITNDVTRSVLQKMDKANIAAEKASSYYEKFRSRMFLKLCTVNIFSFIILSLVLWILFINRYPSMQDLVEYRKEKTDLESKVSYLKQFGYISECEDYLCIRVDINKEFTSKEGQKFYPIISKIN